MSNKACKCGSEVREGQPPNFIVRNEDLYPNRGGLIPRLFTRNVANFQPESAYGIYSLHLTPGFCAVPPESTIGDNYFPVGAELAKARFAQIIYERWNKHCRCKSCTPPPKKGNCPVIYYIKVTTRHAWMTTETFLYEAYVWGPVSSITLTDPGKYFYDRSKDGFGNLRIVCHGQFNSARRSSPVNFDITNSEYAIAEILKIEIFRVDGKPDECGESLPPPPNPVPPGAPVLIAPPPPVLAPPPCRCPPPTIVRVPQLVPVIKPVPVPVPTPVPFPVPVPTPVIVLVPKPIIVPRPIIIRVPVPVMIPGPKGPKGDKGDKGDQGDSCCPEFVDHRINVAICGANGKSTEQRLIKVMRFEDGSTNAATYDAMFAELYKLRTEGVIDCPPPPIDEQSWVFQGVASKENPVWISPPLLPYMLSVRLEILDPIPDGIRFFTLADRQTEMAVGNISFVSASEFQYAPFTLISTRYTHLVRPSYEKLVPDVSVRLSLKPGIRWRLVDSGERKPK